MFWQRIVLGALMIAGLVFLIALDGWCAAAVPPGSQFAAAWRGGPVITLIWLVVAVFAARELGRLLTADGHRPATRWATICCAALAVAPWLCSALGVSAFGELRLAVGIEIVALAGAFVTVALARRAHGPAAVSEQVPSAGAAGGVDLRGAAWDLALTLFVVVYVGLLGSFIPRFRIGAGAPWAVLYVLLVIKSSDIGAYFTGMAVGRHKMIPWLSPKKTIEGLLGGMAFAAGTALGLKSWLLADVAFAAGKADWRVAAFGALMAVLGQTGDLLESLIKRSVGAKDSGAVVPAFGGLLDILDSPLLCLPAAYFIWM